MNDRREQRRILSTGNLRRMRAMTNAVMNTLNMIWTVYSGNGIYGRASNY